MPVKQGSAKLARVIDKDRNTNKESGKALFLMLSKVNKIAWRIILFFTVAFLFVGLSACGFSENSSLLSGVPANAGKLDLSNGVSRFDALAVGYKIGQSARVSVRLEAPDGQVYRLRENEERTPGSYILRLDGTLEVNENGLPQTRLLAKGIYQYAIQASGTQGGTAEAKGQFEITGNPAGGAPQIEGLSVTPAVISPNFDAREDTALIGWRTTQPATVTVSVSGANGFEKIIKSTRNQPAQEDKLNFNGLDVKGEPLVDGIYTYTIQAADKWGNLSRRSGTLEIKGGGRPKAIIEQVTIGPGEIIRGNLITVTMRVRNIGKVAIRSQGPNSGFVYSSREVFSSVENGAYTDAAGFWRVGIDYESNSGSGASRYPFRWGFGKELQPGEAVEITGLIKVERPEEKLRFYAGLIQEQIALPQDRVQITEIKVSN